MILTKPFNASFLLLTLCISFGCNNGSMEKAMKHFDNKRFMVAENEFNRVYKNPDIPKEQKQEAAFLAGQANIYNHNAKDASRWFAKARRKGMKDPILLKKEGEALLMMGSTEEALVKFTEYQKLNPSDPNAERLKLSAEFAMKQKTRRHRYTITSFSKVNTTSSDDFSPMIGDRNNKTLLFTSDREGGVSKKFLPWTMRSYTDIWQISKQGRKGNARWGKPELVEGINTDFSDGVVTFNKRFSVMYFTQCNNKDGKALNCKIYEARKSGKGWEVNFEEPLSFCKDSFTYGHPALSPDGKSLYFSSNRPGGFGNDVKGELPTKDLYVATYSRRGKTWSDPINLGPEINTEDNEVFPYIANDGTLYFSSNGHIGMGGLDMYSSIGAGNQWEKPKNLGFPLNSNGDDFGIVIDDKENNHGYFTSDRARGNDDIYEFSQEPMFFNLSGIVTDCENGVGIEGAIVTITNDKDSTIITVKTNEKGQYSTPLQHDLKYEIIASNRKSYYYDSKSEFVSTVGLELSEDFIRNFCLKNQCDDEFVLPIYFDLDKAFIKDSSMVILDGLIAKMDKYPNMAVELGSHTDCRASYEYNRSLSQRRADSSVSYLIKRGLDPFRLQAKGYGESKLVNDCACEGNEATPCDEEQHAANRRTVVKIISCNYTMDWDSLVKTYNPNAASEDGLISPYLDSVRDRFVDTIDKYNKFLQEEKQLAEAEKQRELKLKAEKELFEKTYDVVPLEKRKENYVIKATIGRSRITFLYNPEMPTTRIPQAMVERLIRAKKLSLNDFKDGKEKIKLTTGEKIYSRSFTLKNITLPGGTILEKVRCKMVDDGKPTILGYNAFRNYQETEIKEDEMKLYLKKIVE